MESKRILLVDDNEEILGLMSDKLLSEGYTVLKLTTGKMIVEKVHEFVPSLILMDIVLPDMDGADAVSLLQDDPVGKDIPVIFLSGIISKETETPSELKVRNRVYPALGKPFTLKELVLKVQKALQ